jgi:ubiquinone/menaquinone biosynthesis C-methylase UbiE
MLAVAKRRAAALGMKNLEFLEMDAEALDFPESSFDAILCRFSLMFLTDLAAALAKIRLMLLPRGKLATSVWDIAPKVPAFSLAYSLAQKMFQFPPPPEGTPAPSGLAGGILEKSLVQAGFVNVNAEVLTGMLELPSTGAFIQFLRDVNVPLISMITHQPVNLQNEYWQALSESIREYVAEDGSIHIPGSAICVAAQR